LLRVARFLRGYAGQPNRGVALEEVTLSPDDLRVPATFLRPANRKRVPGWILLHGVTVPGRHHPVLTRFAKALALSGAAVVVPEVRAWRELRLDPDAGNVAITAAIDFLRQKTDIAWNLNLVGFSFGATKALMSAASDGIRQSIRGVVAFGGYRDLGRTMTFMMTGEHDWGGATRRLDPDPYGRWIVTANYIDRVPGFAHMTRLKQAAYDLATESGRRGVYAAEQSYDYLKANLRATLAADERELWDLIAPPFGQRPPVAPGRELAEQLSAAALLRNPALDPLPWLSRLDQKVVLAHGYDDRLIPYTESLRLRESIGPAADVTLSITRLFGHSREADRLRYHQYPREVGRYVFLLRRALAPS